MEQQFWLSVDDTGRLVIHQRYTFFDRALGGSDRVLDKKASVELARKVLQMAEPDPMAKYTLGLAKVPDG